MNKTILGLLLLLFTQVCVAQTGGPKNVRNRIMFHVGGQDQVLLDKQASPLLYKGKGPAFGLGYERQANNNWWAFQFSGGMLNMHRADESIQFEDPYFSSLNVAMGFAFHKPIFSRGNWQIWAGAKVKENLLLDLNYEIGEWPYAFGTGGLFISPRFTFQTGKHQFLGDLDLPLVNVVTDMPFHQIPRVEGKYPDVPSLLKTGTRMPFWNAFQRVDLTGKYNYALNDRWHMSGIFKWSWLRDSEPLLMKTSQTSLQLGINYTW